MKTAILPVPGLYERVPFSDYRAWPAINHSLLSCGLRSMAHLRYAADHSDEPSEAMNLGAALHAAVFEPAESDRYVAAPDVDRRTKAGKAEWEAFTAANAGKTILRPSDLDTTRRMAEAVGSHTTAARLVGSAGPVEAATTWIDPETSLACKGRLDKFAESHGFIIDLKSTRDASPHGFARSVYSYGYHRQMAFYRAGLRALGKQVAACVIIAVENEPPYGVACYALDEAALIAGEQANRSLLTDYARCIALNKWLGYPDTIAPLSVPTWVLSGIATTTETGDTP